MAQLEERNTLTVCPCCGKQTFPVPAEIDSAEKEHYLACILTGVPYSKTYSLFDGRVQLEMAEAQPSFLDKLTRLSAKATLWEDKQQKSVLSDIVTRLFRYHTIVSISVQVDSSRTIKKVRPAVEAILQEALSEEDGNKFNSIYEKIVSPDVIGTISNLILDKVIITHNRVMDVLALSGFDDSFYKGIPSVS